MCTFHIFTLAGIGTKFIKICNFYWMQFLAIVHIFQVRKSQKEIAHANCKIALNILLISPRPILALYVYVLFYLSSGQDDFLDVWCEHTVFCDLHQFTNSSYKSYLFFANMETPKFIHHKFIEQSWKCVCAQR